MTLRPSILLDREGSGFLGIINLNNENNPGCLEYIRDYIYYPVILGIKINPSKGSLKKTTRIPWKVRDPGFFSWLHLLPGKHNKTTRGGSARPYVARRKRRISFFESRVWLGWKRWRTDEGGKHNCWKGFVYGSYIYLHVPWQIDQHVGKYTIYIYGYMGTGYNIWCDSMFGVLGTKETTFKAEWHRLKWPSATRPPSATFVWAEAGLETHGSNDWNRNTWKHGCTNCFTTWISWCGNWIQLKSTRNENTHIHVLHILVYFAHICIGKFFNKTVI